MPKFTPGIWYVSPTGLSVRTGDDTDDPVRIFAKPEGRVSKREEADWPHNAILGAAAPELYEALADIYRVGNLKDGGIAHGLTPTEWAATFAPMIRTLLARIDKGGDK